MDIKVVGHEDREPSRTASVILGEDAESWRARCEDDGCATVITQPKVFWVPVDAADPGAGCIEVRPTGPQARRCTLCQSKAPTCMRAAQDVRVGQRRVAGGLITAVRTSASGKTVYVTSERYGTERLRPGTRIIMYRDDEEG